MNLEEAYRVLKDQGECFFDREELMRAVDYYEALGFLKGVIEGLLLSAPEDVKLRLQKSKEKE